MTSAQIVDLSGAARMMTRYMAWANNVMLEFLEELPEDELTRKRDTLFGSIAHTFNHVLVIQNIFRAHLEGHTHGYQARNTERPPPFTEVAAGIRRADAYYVGLAEKMTAIELAERVHFEFVDGGRGVMTRLEILLHLVNHATYHRGFISVLLFQIQREAGANDLTVFLRDSFVSGDN